ncbi:MAG: hypothetical protein ABIP94_01480 [Planctomycetota bacterium]
MTAPDSELARLVAESDAETDHQSASAVARRQAVMAMFASKVLRTGSEQFAAGTVLIYSDEKAEVEAAQHLALAAMASEPRARLLAATAYDRLRRLAGAPQKFGTQLVWSEGRLDLWSVDPGTTDSERAKWGVPPLAEVQRRVRGA